MPAGAPIIEWMKHIDPQMSLPQSGQGDKDDRIAQLLRKQQRLRDEAAAEQAKLQRLVGKAHYEVGAFVLNNPESFALVREKLALHLSQLPESRRKAVEEYAANNAALAKFSAAFR